jgi:hypothetical protein
MADVVGGVERLDRRMPGFQFPSQIRGIFLLDLRGIEQHDFRDIGRGVRGEDRTAKSFPEESREISTMVEMGMRENDGIELFRTAAKLFILSPRLSAGALKEPAIQQNSPMLRFEEMLAAGDFSRGAQKRDFHESNSPGLADVTRDAWIL